MTQITVPDIGEFKNVPVIEILVSVGDAVSKDQPLAVLESDKATLEVPCPQAGVIASIDVRVGDRVSVGSALLTLQHEMQPGSSGPQPAPRSVQPADAVTPAAHAAPAPALPGATTSRSTTVPVPDLGDFKDVPVIEILVALGAVVAKDQTLAVLESDKATLDVPSPLEGRVLALDVKVGDRVSAGMPLLSLETATPSGGERPPEPRAVAATANAATATAQSLALPAKPLPVPAAAPLTAAENDRPTHAGPAVRKLARQLGVDLHQVRGTGLRGRIQPEDVHELVKTTMAFAKQPARPATGGAAPFDLLPWPSVDFGKFGPVDVKPLSRIRKLSGANLHRNWVSIPHVTNHDDADITELEAFRLRLNLEMKGEELKISPLAFILKASIAALKAFPDFNASLDGDSLVVKRYYHIGFAADTPNGLVVPVIRDADQKGLVEIAREMKELSAKARAGKLSPADMQGGTFSISSLGGIGGSYFTPIINAPEMAILGVGKTQERVIWADGKPAPRLYLPLSLSWDHRVVDGAAAGRFNAHLVKSLGDVRRLLL